MIVVPITSSKALQPDIPESELYHWSFGVAIFKDTLFHCGFSRENINIGRSTIYEEAKASGFCLNCTWIAEADGLHRCMRKPPPMFFKWSN
ncbi:hypothetical protein HID58_050232 [Brassica napus]|uniref:Uncharacterized protein n=1 Tax=Brassica napus TaxID=3708 RepID=A0ABQ8A5Z9_BRANA|nr:hypothetical protein HID58_050232 [Brassica napus]